MSGWRLATSRAANALVGVALLTGFASPALAADLAHASAEAAAQTSNFALSANATFTTDYIFRGISQTDEQPAIQGGFEATYKILYLGVWGSNVDFGSSLNQFGNVEDVANLEIDWYGGIRPKWKGISFDLGVFYYAYPASLGIAKLDYLEIGTAASYTFFDKLTVGVTNWWSPENSGGTGKLDVLELSASYAFKKIWIVSPSVSALVGRQWGEENEGGYDYTYWNAGLTFDFYEKPALNFDIRYWDTNIPGCSTATLFQCDARVVGSLNAVF